MTFRQKRNPQLVAHMGDHSVYPPNTLLAFRAAFRNGADMVEVDISVTADVTAIAIHGPWLEDWTTGRGRVDQSLWKDIAKLRVRKEKGGSPTDHVVPTLKAVLDEVDCSLPVNLDVKNARALGPTLELLADRAGFGVISGLSPRGVRRLLRVNEDIPLLLNLSAFDKLIARSRLLRSRWLCRRNMRSLLTNKQVVALNLNYLWVDELLISRVHNFGAQVWVFTVPTQIEVDRLIAMGVDSVTVNRPSEIRL